MTIRTAQGHLIETLEFEGRSTPYVDTDQLVVLRVAVDGELCPNFQIPLTVWGMWAESLYEPQFWQEVAESALSMREAEPLYAKGA